jgi:hypothetical protein
MCAYWDRPGEAQLIKIISFLAIVFSSALSCDRERVSALPEAVMHKRFILLLGVVLANYAPMAAQAPAPEIARAQERIAPIMTTVRMVPTALPAPSFARSENFGKSAAAHFGCMFAACYEREPSLKSLSPMNKVKTLFLTQSSLPLVQLWGGRLRLSGFTSRLHMQNVQLGPAGAGGLLDFRPPRQGYPGGPRSISLYGVNLAFLLGETRRYGSASRGFMSPPSSVRTHRKLI